MSEPSPSEQFRPPPMSGWQIASLILAILLLLPGGCFLFFGIGMTADSGDYSSIGPPLLIIGLIIMAVAALCFWAAFRRRRASPAGPAP